MNFNNNAQKKCGFCGESIPYEARRCPYCGSILEITVDNHYGMNAPGNNGAAPGQAWQQPEAGQNVQPGVENGVETDAGRNPEVVPEPDQQTGADGQNGTETNSAPDDTAPNYAYKPSAQYAGNDMPGYPAGNGSPAGYRSDMRTPLSNGLKVFLTVLFTIVPGIGQLAGIITAIVFMNSEGDSDRKSFGAALLVASLAMFVLACIGCFVVVIAYSATTKQFNY